MTAELARFAEADHAAFSRKEDEMSDDGYTTDSATTEMIHLQYSSRDIGIWQKAYAAGLSAAAAACATRAEQHAQAAEKLLPGSAATAFLDLRGEAAACERAIRALAGP